MRKTLVLFLFFLLLANTTACWDVRDVNNTAFAVSMGIDMPDKPKANRYKVTLELAKPAHGQPMPRSLLVSAEGNSVLQAVQQIQTSISRTISFSHLRVLIVGQRLAKQKNFDDFTNYIFKNREIALRLRLLFAQDSEAQEIMHIKPRYNGLVASEIVNMGESQERLSLVRTNNFYDFWSDLKESKGTALGSRAILKGEKNSFIREGAAIYKDWKLKAWLKGSEALYANWLLESTQAIVVGKSGGNIYTYQVSKEKSKIKPNIKKGKLSFLVSVKTNGVVMEESGEGLDFSKEKNLKKMEALFSKTIKKQIQSAIYKSQKELKIDYLGFGKTLKQNNTQAFESLNWEEAFPTVPIKVDVNCRVLSSGVQR